MPSQRPATGTTCIVSKYDVLGEDSQSEVSFLRHVGLASRSGCGEQGSAFVPVLHMGPPLEQEGLLRVHATSTVSLTSDELQQMEVFLEEIESEYAAASLRPDRQYVLVPHADPVRARDGTVRWTRFSCVGLVLETYREAGIELVRIEENALPEVDAEIIDKAYPDHAPILGKPAGVRAKLGIPGDGPWRVVLPGYVFHSMDRPASDVRASPHQARIEHARFP